MSNLEENDEEKEQQNTAGEMDDAAQSQTSEEPSEFSGIAHASMEGTTEQEPLAQAYAAAEPSYILEDEDDQEETEEKGSKGGEEEEEETG